MTDENYCSVYDGATISNFVFSIGMTFGIMASYVPQYIRIYRKRTSEGLSTSFLLLGSCSSLFTVTNIILVSNRARQCCNRGELTPFNCLSSQLSLLQIGVQSGCAILILAFVLLWTQYSIKQDKNEYAKIVRVGYFVGLHMTLSVLQITIATLSNDYGLLMSIANINGLLSTVLTMIKYIPQIYTTYHLKHPGTLSVGMMCIQTPGGFLFTLALMLQKGSQWSSWISYATAASLQGCLLVLCIYYEYFANDGLRAEISERRAIEEIVDENERANSPLLERL